MTVKIRSGSRLLYSQLLSIDGVEHWGFPEYPAILPANDDKTYVVARRDRPDTIARRFYGSPGLWWVIALANDWDLVPNRLNVGEKIIIPSQARVFSRILRRASRGQEGR